MRFILAITILLTGSAFSFAQITISGKIHHYDGESALYIDHAREGVQPFFTEHAKVTPDRNGNFRYSFKNPGIGIMRLSYRRNYYRFLHEEKAAIHFEFEQPDGKRVRSSPANEMFLKDSVRQHLIVKIDGDHKEINRYLNSLARTATVSTQSVSGNAYSLYLADIRDTDTFLQKMDSLRSNEYLLLSRVFDLHADISIPGTADLRSYLEDEINSYYGGIFLNAMFLKRRDQVSALKVNPDTALTMYNRNWERLIERFFQEFASREQRPSSFRYNELMHAVDYTSGSYRDYNLPENPLSLDEMVFKDIISPEYPLDSLFELNNDTKYALLISRLRNKVNSQMFYSPVMKQAIDSMQARYPGSEQLELLEKYFKDLDDYLESQTSPYSKAVIIEENYTTLAGLLEKLEGKTILIDIWATWCHPCIGEFAYKNNFQDFISSGDLVVLYISIDKLKWEDRWRENLNYNRLTGYHILADEVLIRDMWETLGHPKGAIPRYALVSADGTIVIPNAAFPSMGDELRNQILQVMEP